MRLNRRTMGVILALAVFAALLPAAARSIPPETAVAYGMQATRTPRPTILRPTRRPTQTLTPTAFLPSPPTPTRRPTQAFTLAPAPPQTGQGAELPAGEAAGAPALPSEARVEGLVGYGQTLPLSCESRSAVDWAAFFGVEIGEMVFFNRLPRTDDPETGFVGSPYGVWGQIPPYDYGVHAAPVAALLREYGLPARDVRNMALEDALAEIAAGRPVVVWVTGHVEPGRGVEITVNGETRRVARYEHTVILIGYDDARDMVTFQDGARVYERSIEVFLRAWEPLDKLAIVYNSE